MSKELCKGVVLPSASPEVFPKQPFCSLSGLVPDIEEGAHFCAENCEHIRQLLQETRMRLAQERHIGISSGNRYVGGWVGNDELGEQTPQPNPAESDSSK